MLPFSVALAVLVIAAAAVLFRIELDRPPARPVKRKTR